MEGRPRRASTQGLGFGPGAQAATLSFTKHGFGPRVLTGYDYIFIYYDMGQWATSQPSSHVLESIQNRRIAELTMFRSAQDLADIIHTYDTSDLEVRFLDQITRRRGRPAHAVAVAARLPPPPPDNIDIVRFTDRRNVINEFRDPEFREIRQYWSAKPCRWCGAIDLMYYTRPAETRCCKNGKCNAYSSGPTPSPLPPLNPLPNFLRETLADFDVTQYNRDLLYINNHLSFAITGVDKCRDDDNTGGYEPQRGGCVTMYGRTYHRLKKSRLADNGLAFYITGGVPRLMHSARTGQDATPVSTTSSKQKSSATWDRRYVSDTHHVAPASSSLHQQSNNKTTGAVTDATTATGAATAHGAAGGQLGRLVNGDGGADDSSSGDDDDDQRDGSVAKKAKTSAAAVAVSHGWDDIDTSVLDTNRQKAIATKKAGGSKGKHKATDTPLDITITAFMYKADHKERCGAVGVSGPGLFGLRRHMHENESHVVEVSYNNDRRERVVVEPFITEYFCVAQNPIYWNQGTLSAGFFQNTYSTVPREIIMETGALTNGSWILQFISTSGPFDDDMNILAFGERLEKWIKTVRVPESVPEPSRIYTFNVKTEAVMMSREAYKVIRSYPETFRRYQEQKAASSSSATPTKTAATSPAPWKK